ncbi:DUF2605 domain-containing protein [Acaryochloris thomasi]|uniref:DUF2605 domain-containing protein n=1 Tax=Acaryochloris thomasi TaxID=2929456 RepID=UPI000DA64B28|nr:DUF2605 domain-containing protein [Acaryochloris thomasi]
MFESNRYSPEPLPLDSLLANFQYWLSRARSLLEHESLDLLDEQRQAELLRRVQSTLPKVAAARSLFKATSGQIGIEPPILICWHQLVTECWQVIFEFRRSSYAT